MSLIWCQPLQGVDKSDGDGGEGDAGEGDGGEGGGGEGDCGEGCRGDALFSKNPIRNACVSQAIMPQLP